MASFPAHPAIEDDARNLAALAGARSITKEIALPVRLAFRRCLERTTLVLGLEPAGKIARMGACSVDQSLCLGSRQQPFGNQTVGQLRHSFGHRRSDRPHSDGLNERRRMLGCAIDYDPARAIGQIVANLRGKRRRGFERLVGERPDG